MALPRCCDRQNGCVCVRVTTAVLFIIWAVCWAIFMGVGYTLQHSSFPKHDNNLITLGFFLSCCAGIAVGVYICGCTCLWCVRCNSSESRSVLLCEAICLVYGLVMEIFCVTIFCIVGGAAFIAAGNALKDYDPTVLAYGVSAGVFGVLAGCSCMFCQIFCIISRFTSYRNLIV